MSAEVELQNVSIAFGNFYAAKNVNVKLALENFSVFLDPLVVEKRPCCAQSQVFLSHRRVKY